MKRLFSFALFFIIPCATAYAASPFLRDLQYGSGDADVARLQEFLRAREFYAYPESHGNYDYITRGSVIRFQLANYIWPATGDFSGKTRKEANTQISIPPPAEKKLLFNAEKNISYTAPGSNEKNEILTPPTPADSATSTYFNVIKLQRFAGRYSDPNRELVTISNISHSESVAVTGWTITTSRGIRITVPMAYDIPGMLDSHPKVIVLPPGGSATLSSGKQEKYPAFRENICTGYFKEQTTFSPTIQSSCPRPNTSELLYLDDKCLETIPKIRRCATPTNEHLFAQSSACTAYMIQNLSYAGCVRNHRTTDAFYRNYWRIWLGRDTELYRNLHEVITLRDLTGKVVDERKY
jgi:peptidoglycan hydrolase-like protein with peptidoglycan-binding domain